MRDRRASASRRWNEALAGWGIPARITDQAPASPWVHEPAMFRSGADDPTDTPSMRLAREALRRDPTGVGTVLDIGCGGGRSSLPLIPEATSILGVDHRSEMLDQFTTAGALRGVDVVGVLGSWPEAADRTPSADVVVCHHVVYNVGDIAPFVRALDGHAYRRVVVEMTAVHPQSSLAPLWRYFWNLERPSGPDADAFVEVVREIEREPTVRRWQRAERPAPITHEQLVALLRQRLCLTPDRDAELADQIGRAPLLSPDDVVTIAWDPR